MSSNWKEKANLSTNTIHHHQNSTNPNAHNITSTSLQTRICTVTRNLFTLLMETLFTFIKNSLAYMNEPRVRYNQIPLETWSERRLTSTKRKTLILDLDETLIHSSPADQHGRPIQRSNADNRFVTQNFGSGGSKNFNAATAPFAAKIGHALSQFMALIFRTFGGKKTAELFTRPGHNDGGALATAVRADGPAGSKADLPRMVPWYMLVQVPGKIFAALWAAVSIVGQYLSSSLNFSSVNTSHSSYAQRSPIKQTPPAFILPLIMHRERVNFLVRKRPHVDFFLQEVAQWYDLVIYTASLELYGSAVCDMLEKDSKVSFKGRYFRQDCIQEGLQNYTKDLRAVNQDLANTLIIDNSPNAYRYFPDNAIHIHSFVGEADDDHLLRLLPMLDCLRFCSDVRHILSRRTR